MKHALYLAWHSLRWNRGRSLIVILSLAITIWLPVTVRLMLNEFRHEISARAAATPLVIGAPGSRIDLALHALYFQSVPPATTTMSQLNQLADLSSAIAIPLHIRFRTQSQPGIEGAMIVGTSPEYFEFRRLSIHAGEMMSMLGECVIGSRVADRMKLKPGDSIFSAPQNAFNLAGDYPLKMMITGVLMPAHSPDDDAVFTDVRTAWVIEGIGHGHQSLSSDTDPDLLLQSSESTTMTANAGVLPYTEITADNFDSFHFHGEPSEFPLTAVIVVPGDEKSRIRILGHFNSAQTTAQCIKPREVVEELLSLVFRIEQLVWIFSLAAAIVTSLLLALVLSLSMRLRAAEMQTMFRLGCSRWTIFVLQGSEILLILMAACILSAVASGLTITFAGNALRQLLF